MPLIYINILLLNNNNLFNLLNIYFRNIINDDYEYYCVEPNLFDSNRFTPNELINANKSVKELYEFLIYYHQHNIN